MNRRSFLAILSMAFTSPLHAGQKLMKFAFRIKTKDGNIVGNVLIEAKDVEAAKVKLYVRYPGCQILNVQTK